MSKAPLAVLIPAYNPNFFKQTLIGLKNQTFKNFDVYISDDSPNDTISRNVLTWKKRGLFSDLNISIIVGPKNAWLNHHRLDNLYSSNYEFIHFLMDDDFVYPTFYEQHLAAHKHGDFSVSVSQRWLSNEDNIPIGRMPDVGFLTNNGAHFSVLDIRTLANTLLPTCYNWLGELSNMVFRSDGAPLFERPPATIADINYFGLIDLGTCLRVAQKKPLVFISSFHSNFRQHEAQTTHKHGTWGTRLIRLCWASFAITSHSKGLLNDSQLTQNLINVRDMLVKEIPYDQNLSEPLRIIDDPNTTLADKIKKLQVHLLSFFNSNPHLKEYLNMHT